MTSPIAFSQTEARYKMGEAQVEVKIVDSAFNQMLVAPWAMFLTAGYEKETSDGYEKSVDVGGHPGFEGGTAATRTASSTSSSPSGSS